ncbi:hypothetical protein [Brachymonas denitrificans]|uniref:hypothetical protein n=1 Tax=Brachymonas denitrificans TaxID=28220 RepID=UPI00321F976D
MIIGTGLIARSLIGADFGRPVLVLASGVSNSQENRSEAFQREANLVAREISKHKDLHTIYCSTCSVESGIATPYTSHKLQMEHYIIKNSRSCHIFRLPQVVGLVKNRTLVSYFVDLVLKNQDIKVQKYATRNLLDVRDFARIAQIAVRNGLGIGKAQNIATATQIPVLAIVEEIAKILKREVHIETLETGYSQEINIDFLRSLLPSDDPIFDPQGWKKVLQYYVPLIAAEMKS